jgi:hypothetical protein
MGQDSKTIPAELTGSLPRKVSITGSGISSVVIATVTLILAATGVIWFANRAMETIQQTAALHGSGLMAAGQVVDTWREGKAQSLHASYTFPVNGSYIVGKAEIPRSLENGFCARCVISVRYLPSNPAINHPAAWDESASAVWVEEVFSLMPGALGTWLLYMLGGERKLLIGGVPATATATECTRGRNGFFTSFEFRAADGEIISGSYTFGSRQEVGATFCVLYLPQKASSNEPYAQLNSYRIAD